MPRIAAVVALLFASEAAQADAGLPGQNRVPVRVKLTVDREIPGYEFYVVNTFTPVSGRPVRSVPPKPGAPVELTSLEEARPGQADQTFAPRWYGRELYAVLQGRSPPGSVPTRAWLADSANATRVGGLYPGDSVWFFEFRDRIEVEYRIEVGPEGLRLVEVSENPGYGWVCCLSGVLAPVGLVWLGRWVMRRLGLSPTPPG